MAASGPFRSVKTFAWFFAAVLVASFIIAQVPQLQLIAAGQIPKS